MARQLMGLVCALVALGGLLACNSSDPVRSTTGTLSLQLEEVAFESDRITEEVVATELAAMGTVVATAPATAGAVATSGTDERSFTRTRSCPGGGTFTVEGRIVRTWDRTLGLMEAEITGSRTRIECMFSTDNATITVNGSSAWEKFRRRIDGVPDGPQTSHYAGSWLAASSTGEERSCTFDFTVVRDPDAGTRTIEGTMCADRMRRQRAWNANGA